MQHQTFIRLAHAGAKTASLESFGPELLNAVNAIQ